MKQELFAWRAARPGTRSRSTIAGQEAVTRRAWVTLALQSSLAVAATLVLFGGLAFAVVVHEQQDALKAELVRAVVVGDRDDVEDAPPGVALFLLDATGHVVAKSPGAPRSLPDPAGLRAEADHGVWSTSTVGGKTFRTYTVARRDGWIQAATDLGPQQEERQRLLGAAVIAGIAGVLAAGAVGALLARRAVRPLDEALTRQRRFVADASHELRTPLTLLSTRAQLLARDAAAGRLDGVPAESAALRRDAERLGEVINDLLVSAELGGGRGEREVVDVGALAAEVTDAAAAHAAAAGVELVPDVHPATVIGAPTALRRVIASLLDNAIHHANRGGHVAVRVVPTGGDVMLEVSDDGDGFDPEQAERLFERFARGDGAPSGRRFGLGLALVREVVVAHGGRVDAEGHPGAGATFRVHLPPAD